MRISDWSSDVCSSDLKPSSTSNLVSAIPVTPETAADCRTSTASNQPQRRFLPVTVPNSWPRSPSRVPVASSSPVGNGPDPTRVVKALALPGTNPAALGPTPEPPAGVAERMFDDVTHG